VLHGHQGEYRADLSRKMLKEKRSRPVAFDRWILPVISILFIVWGLAYVYHSSFVAIDGHRYFSLVDDAMISMRYAWNFSHGAGLVWNPEERVEGYTNLLMVLLMSAATLFLDKSNAVLSIQLIGIVFVLVTTWLTLKIYEIVSSKLNIEHVKFAKYLLFLSVLVYYPLNYWSLMGMETGLLALLITFAILTSMLYLSRRTPRLLLLTTILLGLAFLTRNDSLIYALLVFGFLGISLRSDKQALYLLFINLAVYGLFIIGQEAFRSTYYGTLVPNTYTLKLVGMPLLERLKNGWGFIGLFFVETGYVLLIAAVGALINASVQKMYLLSFILASTAYQIYVGGDPWIYWRMMAPVMPVLMIVFIIGCCGIAEKIARILNNRFFRVAALFLVFVSLVLIDFRFLPEVFLFSRPDPTATDINQVNLAVAINAVTNSSATLGVLHSGILPYYAADHRAIDFLGKSDPYIASLPPDLSGWVSWHGMESVPGHNKYDLNYSIKKLRPTYVESFRWGSQDLLGWSKDYYVQVTYDGIAFYVLKDSPAVYWNKVQIGGLPAPTIPELLRRNALR
jgi:arabinofuranosyltransferase